MTITLAGSTGTIGSQVLQKCLHHLSIDSLVALSRRPLPTSVTSNPKLTVIIMEDFLSYSDSILRQLDGERACIWYAFRAPTYSNTIGCQAPIGKTGHWVALPFGIQTLK
jgi:hypothetical protein